MKLETLFRVSALAACVSLSACGGGSSSDSTLDTTTGSVNGPKSTACVYDQYAGGGGRRICQNMPKSYCDSATYGANQSSYSYSTCADLGY